MANSTANPPTYAPNAEQAPRKERYFLEDNASEVERLAYQHELFESSMPHLVLAPMDLKKSGIRILDSGTTDGTWLRAVEKLLAADHSLVGADLVPKYFPSSPPPGAQTTFLVQSITEAWPTALHGSFDLVHQRLAFNGCGGSSVREAVKRLVGLLAPGGWIQLIEPDSRESVEGNSPALERVMQLIQDITGISYSHFDAVPSWLRDAGLVGVDDRVIDLAIGARNSDLDLARKSIVSYTQATMGIVAAAKAQESKRFSTEELDTLVPDLVNELQTKGGVFRVRAVWGQMPSS